MSKTKKAAAKELPADHVNTEVTTPVEQPEETNSVPSGNPVEENPETTADYESTVTPFSSVAEESFENAPVANLNESGDYEFTATKEFIEENELQGEVNEGDVITVHANETTDELNVTADELLSDLSFSAALNLMKSGKHVTRGHAAWDGRELYISGGVIYDKRPNDTQVYAWSCVQHDILASDYRVL